MTIQRKVYPQLPKRQIENVLIKNEKIGELLGLDKVPKHTLTYKEPRLDLASGDCYPLVDVLERIAEMVGKTAKPRAQGKVTQKDK